MCRSVFPKHIRRRGRSVSGKVVSLSKSDLGNMPCLSPKGVNSAGKASRHRSCWPDNPTAYRVSGVTACAPRPINPLCGGLERGAGTSACLASGDMICWGILLRLCSPFCRLSDVSWSEATVDTRSWMLVMMNLRLFGGTSYILIASSSVSSYSSLSSKAPLPP